MLYYTSCYLGWFDDKIAVLAQGSPWEYMIPESCILNFRDPNSMYRVKLAHEVSTFTGNKNLLICFWIISQFESNSCEVSWIPKRNPFNFRSIVNGGQMVTIVWRTRQFNITCVVNPGPKCIIRSGLIDEIAPLNIRGYNEYLCLIDNHWLDRGASQPWIGCRFYFSCAFLN